MFRISQFLAAACLPLAVSCAWAQGQSIDVKDAWVRSTVPGQTVGGAYMDITSKVPAHLVGAASPVAGSADIHQMSMQGGVMKMSGMDGLDLPAGRTVKLAPGGYHVMLMDLKHPLKAGDHVPLRLTFEFAGKKRETVDLNAEVRDVAGEMKHSH
jgi:copper(I)-binding protein